MTTIINQRPRKASEDNFGIRSALSDTENDDMFVRAEQENDSFE